MIQIGCVSLGLMLSSGFGKLKTFVSLLHAIRATLLLG